MSVETIERKPGARTPTWRDTDRRGRRSVPAAAPTDIGAADAVDLAVEQSFPASDPPAWTGAGVGGPGPARRRAAGYRNGPASPLRLRRPVDVPRARIYRPARAATQSGLARTRGWVLEFEPRAPAEIDPLMGWTGSRDPLRQVRLTFPNRERAVEFAERQCWAYTVIDPPPRRLRPKSYTETVAPRHGRPLRPAA